MCLRKDLSYPCGKCLECLQSRRNDWAIRLANEIQLYDPKSNYFFTLTYDDEHVPYVNGVMTLSKRDIELFLKRLRSYVAPKRFKFFMCGEYGPTTYRPHYHIILFNFPKRKFKKAVRLFNKAWKNGQVRKPWLLVPAQCVYATKYLITDFFTPEGAQKPFNKMSLGLGLCMVHTINPFLCERDYIKAYADSVWGEYSRVVDYWKNTKEGKVLDVKETLVDVPLQIVKDFGLMVQDFIYQETDKGVFKYKIPKYIRQKIFTKEERELLNLYQNYLRKEKKEKYDKDYLEYDLQHPGNEMWRQQARIKEERKREKLNKKYKLDKLNYLQ